MTIRLLFIFKTVVECGSITKAAQKLYMSQPAVTHAIQELEERVSITLFDRIGKRLYVSETGKLFYQKTCKLLTMYEELESSAQGLEKDTILRVGSSITNANLLLPKLLARFHELYPNPVKVVVDNAKNIEEKLYRNEVDIAFLEGALSSSQIVELPLFSFDIALFCHRDHHLAKFEEVSLLDLCNETWLLREKGSAIRDTLDSAYLLLDRIIEPAWESVNSQVLIEAVKKNLGISVLPVNLLEPALQEGCIKILKLTDALSCMNHIVYHKDKHIPQAMANLLEISKEYQVE